MIKALIFDFDGLILDTETPEVIAWQEVYSRYGVEFPVLLWGRIVGGNGNNDFDPIEYLRAQTGREIDGTLEREDKRVRDRQLVAEQGPLPGVEEMLQAADRLGLRCAIASSSTHAWVDGQLKRLGLYDYFDAIVCREEVERVKPDPQLFEAALRALGVGADEALVFEDSPNGVKAGRAAGIRVVAVPNPVTALLEIEGAEILLDSLADLTLEELLEKVNH
jgi:HAD superfamily hydrolase (TIGR01509 family)